jgi:hypothetical protein
VDRKICYVNLAGSEDLHPRNASFFSVARFGPGAIIIFALLLLFAALLYFIGYRYLAIGPIAVALIIFLVLSVQIIDEAKLERKIVGQKCLVIKKISKGDRGIVKVYKEDGDLDHELWSAEGLNGAEIQANSVARIAGIRSIILLVEPDLVTS